MGFLENSGKESSRPEENCLSRLTPFQYCLMAILAVTVPFFIVLLGVHLVYRTTNLGESEKCENLCDTLKSQLNISTKICKFSIPTEGMTEIITKITTASPPTTTLKPTPKPTTTKPPYETKMKFKFKKMVALKARKQKAEEARSKSNTVPVIVERDPAAFLDEYTNSKNPLSIAKDLLWTKFKDQIRIKLGVNTLYLYVNDTMNPVGKTVSDVHNTYQEQDGILYVAYSDVVNSDFTNRTKLDGKMRFKYKQKYKYKQRLLKSLYLLRINEQLLPVVIEKDPISTLKSYPEEISLIRTDTSVNDLYKRIADKINAKNIFIFLFVQNTFVPKSDRNITEFYVQNFEDDNNLYVAYSDDPNTLFVEKDKYDKTKAEPVTEAPLMRSHTKLPFNFNSHKAVQTALVIQLLKKATEENILCIEGQHGTEAQLRFVYIWFMAGQTVAQLSDNMQQPKFLNKRLTLYLYLVDRKLEYSEVLTQKFFDDRMESDNCVYVMLSVNPNLL